MFEFHILRKLRDEYSFDSSLYQLSGNVVFFNLKGVREFALKLNKKRLEKKLPYIKPAELNAMGLIDEILHFVVERYEKERRPDAFSLAIERLNIKFGKIQFENTIINFLNQFPPRNVYLGNESVLQYFKGKTKGVSNLTITLKEILLLFLANENPAFAQFKELFDDEFLKKETKYIEIISFLQDFFKTLPPFGPYNQSLIELLKSPMHASPHSLYGQLEYIKKHWGSILSSALVDRIMKRILIATDFIKEEEKWHLVGPGPALVPEFKPETECYYDDEEHFSPDTKWMPNVVMIVKHTYVYLDQLSKKYKRSITKLNEIPNEELDTLKEWGFNALWLIGIWERSKASAKIKRLCGNPEASASAYSIYDYVIADELGGEEAFNDLRERASKRNIRIAVDIVPNHTAIDGRWIVEHPEWFIQTKHPPFFNYRFSGPDLSENPAISIYIETGYYNRTDAAVVFKLVENTTGRVRYIYHGNDGTSTPWNDTAQLNFLLPEVREAVMRKIIEVARKSPIIRLDAAMTLTKRHYQRLWFPEPGKGGDIPSRVEYGMTRAQFNKLFPREFWREVVERVALEAPDTLLIAEAFWLMEGYFVRNLGMHRVYNSAFMNMLKMEENQKYHQVLKNILEFNPRILERFVNFMSNPDELTAVEQFGKEDKYFGVCVLLSTMPGLCLFAHGQIEGYKEKYGMEYKRAYWNELPDEYLIKRHQREIFPLLKRRYLFSGIENFILYEFRDESGRVNDNVFAYSNSYGDERALVIYNNRYEYTRGWIKNSVPYRFKKSLIQKGLNEGLNLKGDNNIFYIFKEFCSKLEFLYSGKEFFQKGLYVELGAYKYKVFLEIEEIRDNEDRDYEKLARLLNGMPVKDVHKAVEGIRILNLALELKKIIGIDELERISLSEDKQIGKKIIRLYRCSEVYELKDEAIILLEPQLVKILSHYTHPFNNDNLLNLLKDEEAKNFLTVHQYDGIWWFNKERFEELLTWLFVNFLVAQDKGVRENLKEVERVYKSVCEILKLAEEKGYRYTEFINAL